MNTGTSCSHQLVGLEPDNLLSWLALLGLLRALEKARPLWRARAYWERSPWRAWLQVVPEIGRSDIAVGAAEGVDAIAAEYDVDGRANVSFGAEEFHAYAERMASGPVTSRLAAALAVEFPFKKDGGIQAGPLIMMFGQGHQNFLERLTAVSRGGIPARLRKAKHPPDFRSPSKIEEALFEPWKREDDADAFRWDPEEDQRYALRYDDPSRTGAAPTVHGANRLAAIGLLSFPSFPAQRRAATRGVSREGGTSFVWPIWKPPMSLGAIEQLVSHPELVRGNLSALAPYGVMEIFRARRVSNGKFRNVARGQPAPVPQPAHLSVQ